MRQEGSTKCTVGSITFRGPGDVRPHEPQDAVVTMLASPDIFVPLRVRNLSERNARRSSMNSDSR